MILTIGNKPFKELTQEDLYNIVLIEGVHVSLEFWNKPEVIRFDNKLFSDTFLLEYVSYRKEDHQKSSDFCFYFNFNDFSYHYTKDYELNPNQPGNRRRIKIETLRYLIEQGFDVPLYKTEIKQ